MRFIFSSILFRSLVTYFCVLGAVGWSKTIGAQLDCGDIKCVRQKVEASFDCSNDEMLVESLSMSEAEINLYLAAEESFLDQGYLKNVSAELLGDGNVRLNGTITLDMGGVENGQELGLLKLLDGRSVDVQLVVTVESGEGLGVVRIEGAEIAGFNLSLAFVEQLILPDGVEDNKSFMRNGKVELPCGIREMVVNDGGVVFVR